MRFIEMTSGKFRIKDVAHNGGAPNYKRWWHQAQKEIISFYSLNLSIGMPYYKGGHNKLAKVCNQVLNLIHIHPHMLSRDSQLITVFTLAVLPSAAMPHLKRGIAVVESWHYHNLTNHWGIYTFPIPPLWLLFLLCLADWCPTTLISFYLLSIGDLELPSIPLWFPHQSLREKAINSIREQIHWSPKPKSTWFTF